MSLYIAAAQVVAERGRADVDVLMLLPQFEGATRKQTIGALQNAAHKGLVHLVGRVQHGAVRGQRAGIYAPGPAPNKKVAAPRPAANSGKRGVLPKVSSVWELASAIGAN